MAFHTPPLQPEPPSGLISLGLRLTGEGAFLTGKAFATTRPEAEKEAGTLWRMCRALLPEGLSLIPASSPAEYIAFAGFDPDTGEGTEEGSLFFTELRRLEEAVPVKTGAGVENLYLLHPFNPAPEGWPQLQRAFLPGQSLLVTLHPTWLYPEEREWLLELEELFDQLSGSDDPAARRKGGQGRRYCREMLTHLEQGFSVRLYLLSQGEQISRLMVQVAGTVLGGGSLAEPGAGLPTTRPGLRYSFEEDRGIGQGERDLAVRNFLLLENEYWGELKGPARYERLRYLCGLNEAALLFRPPGIIPAG
jgi:hypothetical protein